MSEEPKKETVEEPKVPEQIGESVPAPESAEPKTTEEVPELSDRAKARMAIETRIGEATPLPPETPEAEIEEPAKAIEPEKVEEPQDETQRLKDKISKRIGKEVAKRKTLEEQLAEKDAEIERLKAGKQDPAPKQEDKKEPTSQEIAAALKKAREDGDTEFEVQILEYIAERKAKKEREEAEKSYNQVNSQATERQRKWFEIVQDYMVLDDGGVEVKDHPLNLNNEKSQLYKTANALYLDPELKKTRYSQGTEAENLRRAVSDAYVELTRMGVTKSEVKEPTQPEGKSAKERQKSALAEPGAAVSEPTEPKGPPKPQTEQDKVLDEIRNRNKYRQAREPVFT